ncbi:ATP-binding cassette domain-containing protein [Salmonella enterica]|uniref:ATP-binding cassette domain-containing protein n=1 Tax=Salmonella enterica TaxID=28901 RepID=UPI003D1564E5
MLEARDLYCERDERTLFRGLSFTVDAGEWVQVTGGNGAGKTTLLGCRSPWTPGSGCRSPAATAPEKPPCCAC